MNGTYRCFRAFALVAVGIAAGEAYAQTDSTIPLQTGIQYQLPIARECNANGIGINAGIPGHCGVPGILDVAGQGNFGADVVAAGNVGANSITSNSTITAGGDITGQNLTARQNVNGRDLVITNTAAVGGTSTFGGLITGTITNAQNAAVAALALSLDPGATVGGGQVVGSVGSATNADFATLAGRALIADGLSSSVPYYQTQVGSKNALIYVGGAPVLSVCGSGSGCTIDTIGLPIGAGPVDLQYYPPGSLAGFPFPLRVTVTFYDICGTGPIYGPGGPWGTPGSMANLGNEYRILVLQSYSTGCSPGFVRNGEIFVNTPNSPSIGSSQVLMCPSNMRAITGQFSESFTGVSKSFALLRNGGSAISQPTAAASSAIGAGYGLSMNCVSQDPNFPAIGQTATSVTASGVPGLSVGTVAISLDIASQNTISANLGFNPL